MADWGSPSSSGGLRLFTLKHGYALPKVGHLPKCDQQIYQAQTGNGPAKPSRCNRRTQDRQPSLFSEKSQQIIVSPVANYSEGHPREQREIEAKQKAKDNKENDG